MQKTLLFIPLLLITICSAAAQQDTTIKIPVFRQTFHDKIDNEQVLADKADGLQDHQLQVSKNEEINLQVSDAFFRKVDELQLWVEGNAQIGSNNDKVRFLRYIEMLVRSFRIAWRNKEMKPVAFPALYRSFEIIIKDVAAGKSMLPEIQAAEYEIAKINTAVFYDSKENSEAQNIVYLKYTRIHPENILKTIRPFVNESFADSLVIVACENNPVQLYSYAQSTATPEGKLIHRNQNPMVKVVSQLSQTPNALLYFPFLDDLLHGKNNVETIGKLVGDGIDNYDSLGYFKLLVQTEISYFKRLAPPARDTPIAMFGPNGLREVLKGKAYQHFIKHINELHEASLPVRMKAIQPLGPQELYYMLIMGEADIYTSSYKHSYARLMQVMGSKPRGDSLLQSVHFDFFKKFIKMAANFNQLDGFLKTMPAPNSEILMKAFVANLDKTGNLEDAVDVADSYSSINDPKLLRTILNYVDENEQKNIAANDAHGKLIYGLLKKIFLSSDSSNKTDISASMGIPSIYSLDFKELQDEKGRVVQQVFFYGDEDGKAFFPPFVNAFSPKDWTITSKKEWVEFRSKKGNAWVFANKPLDYNLNLDDSAQAHLGAYLEQQDMHPTIVVHRGHSYWLPGTIKKMAPGAKVVVLGSCGGYQNLNQILEVCPDAHIISTKEIGKGDINKPILSYLNEAMVSGQTLYWKDMWKSLTSLFSRDPSAEVRESWEDYIPPYRNLGAIFLKAYHKQTEDDASGG